MTRDNLLFAIIGILLGFIVGFMVAGSMSQREAAVRAGAITGQQGQSLPPDHPPIGSDQGGAPQQTMAQVQDTIARARNNPKDFDAQIMAAKLEYQIQQFDEAIKFLLTANQIRPSDREVLAMLGVANMDAGHFEPAEKWYRAAMVKKPDDIPVLDGLCAVLLSAGKIKLAEEAINKLEKLDPTNQDLSQFRSKLAELKSSKSK
jgi:Flp pilus assembly protein TadD